MIKDNLSGEIEILFKSCPGFVFTTKEISEILGVSTLEAYHECISLMDLGFLTKYGYRTKDGWEDPEHSKLQTKSLGWQWVDK